MIYLDEAATTPLKRDVLAAMGPYLGPEFGNPSSHHEPGFHAKAALDEARASVAGILGCRPSEITFTSGGTEADNLAIKGIALGQPRGQHVVVSAVEHPAVLESAAWLDRLGFEVTTLGVDRDGLVSPDALAEALRDDTTLVSIQYANNEVGTIQSVSDLAAIAAAKGVPFHTDAVQAAGWLDLDVNTLGVQAMSISGHKLGAPKGVGVLYANRWVELEPLIHGGGQESGRRSGTENVASAVGMAKALELAGDRRSSRRAAAYRDHARLLRQAGRGHRRRAHRAPDPATARQRVVCVSRAAAASQSCWTSSVVAWCARPARRVPPAAMSLRTF